MKLVSIRDFRANAAAVRKQLESEGEIVLTVSGTPFAILTPVQDDLERELAAIRRARARRAVDKIREHSRREGLDQASMSEVDELVGRVRRERRSRAPRRFRWLPETSGTFRLGRGGMQPCCRHAVVSSASFFAADAGS